MSLPVATLLAVSLFASGPLDLYAPTGTAMAVQSPADPALPEGCYGVATADRTGLLDEEPSVWTCEVPADGTDVLAAIDLVGGSWRPVLLRWWDGAEWVRFAEAPVPEALTREVAHVVTTDATPQVVRVLQAESLAPFIGDGFRAELDCVATSATAPNYLNPKTVASCWRGSSGSIAPCGWVSSGQAPVGSPFWGVKTALTYGYPGGWLGAPALAVQGVAGVTLRWGCEVTIRTTAEAP